MLNSVSPITVSFDPANVDHQEAARLLLKEHRMHPTLRFRLEGGYVNIRMMMLDRVAHHFLNMQPEAIA